MTTQDNLELEAYSAYINKFFQEFRLASASSVSKYMDEVYIKLQFESGYNLYAKASEIVPELNKAIGSMLQPDRYLKHQIRYQLKLQESKCKAEFKSAILEVVHANYHILELAQVVFNCKPQVKYRSVVLYETPYKLKVIWLDAQDFKFRVTSEFGNSPFTIPFSELTCDRLCKLGDSLDDTGVIRSLKSIHGSPFN